MGSEEGAFPANASGMAHWEKLEQRVAGGERWTFHFAFLGAPPASFPTWSMAGVQRESL